MGISGLTSREAVLQAIAEYDALGASAFLKKYGYGPALSYFLIHDGQRYFSKAIAGVAYGYQHPSEGYLRPQVFSGGRTGAAKVLQSLGFTIDEADTPAKILRRFDKMQTTTDPTGSPTVHKYLLALVLLRRVRHGEPRLIEITTLATELAELLSAALPDSPSTAAWEPLWHLEETLWELVNSEGHDPRPSGGSVGKTKVGVLQQDGLRGGLTEAVHELLTEAPHWIGRIEKMIVSGHLSKVPSSVIEAARGADAPPLDPSSADRKVWTVHVGQQAVANLDHSLPDGRWGWKVNQPDYSDLAPGDLLILAAGYTGKAPRAKVEEFSQFGYGRLAIAEVTDGVQQATEPYWPDETHNEKTIYPFRVSFMVLEERVKPTTIAALSDEFQVDLGWGFQRSATKQSQAILAGSTSWPSSTEENPMETPTSDPLTAVVHAFADELTAAGWSFGAGHHLEFVRRFVVSLAAKPFLILTGLSGSGKTQIAAQFGRWLGEDRWTIIPVRPDWTTPEALLGYENGLSPLGPEGHAWYVPSALQFMLRAARDPRHPYVMVLDEMNLAHVERYFADLLSGMESGQPVLPNLAATADGWRLVPGAPALLPLPPNLFVLGTVNIDETTYMFSPKVLDRASTIEFRVTADDIKVGDRPHDVDAGGDDLVDVFLDRATHSIAISEVGEAVLDRMKELHALLAPYGREFGHRTVAEATRCAELLALAGEPDPDAGLDIQVIQKVLPKFHGSIRELATVLNIIGSWCATLSPELDSSFDVATASVTDPRLPLSFHKVQRMAQRLRAQHFVSFAE